jgi:septal ring factor EnvC (AmiA/AmiB activator)
VRNPIKERAPSRRELEKQLQEAQAEAREERQARFHTEGELQRNRDQLRNIRYHVETMEREAAQVRTLLLVVGA